MIVPYQKENKGERKIGILDGKAAVKFMDDFEMTAEEIVKFITDNYNTFKRLDLCVSGINYKIFVKQDNAVKVSITTADGKPIDGKKKYSVAMNSYMSTAYQLPTNDKGTGLGVTTTETVVSYLLKQNVVTYANPTRGDIVSL